MAAAVENLRAAEGGVNEQEICAVLKLIAKADRPAGLIDAAAREDPAGIALVYGPGIHIVGKRRIRTVKGKALQILPPPDAGGTEKRVRIEGAQSLRIGADEQQCLIVCLHGKAQCRRTEVTFRRVRGRRTDIDFRSRKPCSRIPEPDKPVMLLKLQSGRIFRTEAGMELPAKRQTGRAPHCQHAHIRTHGDKHAGLNLPPRNHSAPDTDAWGIADLAGSQPVGKETDRLSIDQNINRLRPCLRADVRRGRQQAHFPRIFEP